MRKTKIVCTIGPATESWEMLTKLVFRGMNVARLNTTHGDLEEHRERIRRIKEVRNSLKVPLSLLLDLSGPKIRTGSFKKERVELLPGRDFLLTTSTIEGDETGVSVNYDRLPGEVKPGHVILMDDGKIKLKVLSTDERCILTKVINGGVVTHRRGINLPGIDISIPAVTEKDRGFIKLGIEEAVDYFSLSYVRKEEDVILARQIETDSRGSYQLSPR